MQRRGGIPGISAITIGAGQAPKTGAVSVRTSNRNFEGRTGTKSAQVYLASPESAVAAALTGVITDPRDLGLAYPRVKPPAEFWVDDSLVLPPSEDPAGITVFRGPNIGDPPKADLLPDTIKGVVAIKVGDKITTDHIMPAGSRLKYRSNIPKYAEFVFEGVDPQFAKQALANKQAGVHNVVIAGESYGQGSSREHAAICPMYLGVKAVIARRGPRGSRTGQGYITPDALIALTRKMIRQAEQARCGARFAGTGAGGSV